MVAAGQKCIVAVSFGAVRACTDWRGFDPGLKLGRAL